MTACALLDPSPFGGMPYSALMRGGMPPLCDHPAIYLKCASAAYQGIEHGAWFNAAQETDALAQEVDAFLARSPHAREPFEQHR